MDNKINLNASPDHLLLDLEEERRAKEKVDQENAELQKTIRELELYLRQLDVLAISGSAEENEWKIRSELGKKHGLHLADHQAWLEEELQETKWKLETSSYPDIGNCDMESMTGLELVRLVRHLERIKLDYHTSVCSADYKLEQLTKEFQHFDGMRRKFKTELRHDFQEMERMNMNERVERQTESTLPLTPASLPYLQWLGEVFREAAKPVDKTSLPTNEPPKQEIKQQVQKEQQHN